jgi:hypothetical protein
MVAVAVAHDIGPVAAGKEPWVVARHPRQGEVPCQPRRKRSRR